MVVDKVVVSERKEGERKEGATCIRRLDQLGRKDRSDESIQHHRKERTDHANGVT